MRRFTPILAVAALLGACADTAPTGPTEDLAEFHPALGANVVYGSYIVVLKDGANPRSVAAISGVNPSHVYEAVLNGFAAELNHGQLNALRRNPSVDYIDADGIASIPTPRIEGKPGGGGGGGQVVPWGITRVGGAGDGTGRTAWILDTGIDFAHADLNVDVGRSRDFTGSRNGAIDENGHGTHVAGTIAAKNNTIDVVGVAAGASVVAVRVLDRRGSGAWSWIIAGIDYVGANGNSGDVANMALSGPADRVGGPGGRERGAGRREVRAGGRQRRSSREQQFAGSRERREHLHDLGDRQQQLHHVVVELRQPAGRLRRAGLEHSVHSPWRWHDDDERHLDGCAACGRHPAARRDPQRRQRVRRSGRHCRRDRHPLTPVVGSR